MKQITEIFFEGERPTLIKKDINPGTNAFL